MITHIWHRDSRRSRMRPPSEQKSLNRRNGQCLDALPLAQKLRYNCFLQDYIEQPWWSDLRGGGKQKAWRKKRKYDSIFSLLLRLLPLQLLQDHRDGNLERMGGDRGWRPPPSYPRPPSGCCTCQRHLKRRIQG
jgi:hypothetical protein